MDEARCGAVCPGKFVPVLKIGGKLRITQKFGRNLPKVWPQGKLQMEDKICRSGKPYLPI